MRKEGWITQDSGASVKLLFNHTDPAALMLKFSMPTTMLRIKSQLNYVGNSMTHGVHRLTLLTILSLKIFSPFIS
jgi:hypothetical protein